MTMRTRAMTVGIVALALFLPACAKDDPAPKPGTGASTAVTDADKAFQFRKCLREHGLKVDEPKPGGDQSDITIAGNGTDSQQKFEEAQKACQQPQGGRQAGDTPQNRDAALKYAKCMRENGFNMSDPTDGGQKQQATKVDPAKQAVFDKANAACGGQN